MEVGQMYDEDDVEIFDTGITYCRQLPVDIQQTYSRQLPEYMLNPAYDERTLRASQVKRLYKTCPSITKNTKSNRKQRKSDKIGIEKTKKIKRMQTTNVDERMQTTNVDEQPILHLQMNNTVGRQ